VIGVPVSHAVAAGSTYSLTIVEVDEPGEVSHAQYVVTVAVTGATGNSTVNYAYLGATVY
jgi:hypothetical protein